MGIQVQGYGQQQNLIKPADPGNQNGTKIGQGAGLVAGSVIGGVLGAAAGGIGALPGAAAGGALGGALGTFGGGFFDDAPKPAQYAAAAPSLQPIQTPSPISLPDPMSRQMAMMDSTQNTNPLQIYAQGLQSLRQFDPSIQQQYTPPLLKAYHQEWNNQFPTQEYS